MAKQFTDFTFRGKKFSDMKTKYISVDFDSNNDSTSLGMERDMEKGETNRYRVEANYFYDSWSSPIEYIITETKDSLLLLLLLMSAKIMSEKLKYI